MDIYKDDVIDALNDNREFTVGRYSYPKIDHWYEGISNSIAVEECATCAVGSIIRNVYPNKNSTDVNVRGRTVELRYNYMRALSIFWETLHRKNDITITFDEMRTITMDWVEDVFPEDEILATL